MLKNAFSDDICRCFSSVLMNGGGLVTTWILFKYFYLDPTEIMVSIAAKRRFEVRQYFHRMRREKMNSKKLTDEKFW